MLSSLLLIPFLFDCIECSSSVSIMRIDFSIIQHDLVKVLIELILIAVWRVRGSEILWRYLVDEEALGKVEFTIRIGLVREEDVRIVFDVGEILLEIVFR